MHKFSNDHQKKRKKKKRNRFFFKRLTRRRAFNTGYTMISTPHNIRSIYLSHVRERTDDIYPEASATKQWYSEDSSVQDIETKLQVYF